jgi:hypothetical protein
MTLQFPSKLTLQEFQLICENSKTKSQKRNKKNWTLTSIAEDLVYDLSMKLIFDNKPLLDYLYSAQNQFDHTDCFSKLSEGQIALYCLNSLNGEVNNGGIEQYFWNHPDRILPTQSSLEIIGPKDLFMNYQRATASLDDNIEQWIALRKQCYSDTDNPSWESFTHSYNLLELEWFNDAYYGPFDEMGSPDDRGLGSQMMIRLSEYLTSRPYEFILFAQ